MASDWLLLKQECFVRDVLRDFCQIASVLEQHFSEFDTSGELSFHLFDDLLGSSTSQGLLWRLKDTAHLLFRNDTRSNHTVLGEYLDWALGYIFHECIKLKEDAYQQMNYKPRFRQLQKNARLSPEEQYIATELYSVIDQTSESIAREVQRVRFILFHCKRMFILYLPLHADNALLARYFYANSHIVQSVFKGLYNDLMESVYPHSLDRMFTLAAESFADGGWKDQAQQARELAQVSLS